MPGETASGQILSSADRAQILDEMRTLPAHPEVAECLARLRSAGLRLAVLTNSTLALATDQLTHAGLADYFEQILSADMARRLKPAREPYQTAAEHIGCGDRRDSSLSLCTPGILRERGRPARPPRLSPGQAAMTAP